MKNDWKSVLKYIVREAINRRPALQTVKERQA
jgi:hypothetical protein